MKHLLICVLLIGSFSQAQALSRKEINTVVSGSKEKYHGLREFKPVLDGVLYRGGGSGGKNPLKTESLEALCEDGFTDAAYLYPDNWKNQKLTNCRGNRVEYAVHGFRGEGAVELLARIHEVIKTGGKMFVHCWNGWHASGEIAAYSLIQFCDFSNEEADQYWKQNRGDKAVISRIKKFKKVPGLEITAEEKARICPSK